MTSKLVLTLIIYHLISTVGFTRDPIILVQQASQGRISTDSYDIERASLDFGRMVQTKPLAVLHPSSAEDVVRVVKWAYNSPQGFMVSARGHGHSINGQAQASNGVVIQMSGGSRRNHPNISMHSSYVDVWGGELWIDVLNLTLQYGLAPKSWTDYLYLSVGGTLSNAGISGQAFNYGPQITNVYELDVVTGKGELLTCSKQKNSELFHGVLGGLGQFGIITRARIALKKAPQRVRWIRVLYNDFSTFTNDQEFLISLHGNPAAQRFDYVEGFVIVDEGLVSNWRSSFFSPKNITTLNTTPGGVLYCLEITKDYHDSTANTIDQEVEVLLKKLKFIPSSVFTTDLPYVDFLDRVHKSELKLRSKGLWEVAHPWLNLFVPKSRIGDFDQGVFKRILGNKTSGPVIVYPMNKNKWESRNSVVTPEEDVFYTVGLLPSAYTEQELDYLRDQNQRILKFCDQAGIKVKQYLPNYNSQKQWKRHFEGKWEMFVKRKMEFDPKHILATGQRIFEHVSSRVTAAVTNEFLCNTCLNDT